MQKQKTPIDNGGDAMSTDHNEQQLAGALKHIARNETIKAYILQHAPLYTILRRAASRFIGGERLAECLQTAQQLQEQGHAVTIDYMGESTRTLAMALEATDEFLRVIEAVADHRLDASVSLDLSHVGLAVDEEVAFTNMSKLAQSADDAGLEIMISMEGSERTTAIFDMHQRLCEHFTHIGITLQAYLHRTVNDLSAALQRPGKIRLAKGAYEEPTTTAQSRGEGVDAPYRTCMELLFTNGHPCSIATHDQALLDHAQSFIQERGLNSTLIEFEMLHGVTPERLQLMRDRGYRTRVYLPYGQEWYLYLCHRLAEYPPNVYQAIIDAVEM
jgi:proline dehydrogenase